MERSSLAELDLVLLQGMDDFVAAKDFSTGDLAQQVTKSQVVIGCTAFMDTTCNKESGSEKGNGLAEKFEVTEIVVDIDSHSSSPALQLDLQKYHNDSSGYLDETIGSHHISHLWFSRSQDTCLGEVSVSVGEATGSGDECQDLLPQQNGDLVGGSLGLCKDNGDSEASDVESNRQLCEQFTTPLHGDSTYDGHSAEYVGVLDQFGFSTPYSDDGAEISTDRQVAGSEDVARNAECLDAALFSSEVVRTARDDEVLSGHASDPGFYEREYMKQSPEVHEDRYTSPPMDMEGSILLQSATLGDAVQGFPVEEGDEKIALKPQISSKGLVSDVAKSSLGRVKEWIDSIQLSDMLFDGEEEDVFANGKGNLFSELHHDEAGVASSALHQTTDTVTVDHVFVNAAVRSLHPLSTVAHISGIGLREVPSLGMFSFLKTLNLSANLIVRVPAGCLPRSLHSLDLSRNSIAQIEGFRELTRLRVLNLSHNRISRIGHGLANCTLIKELHLAGNKIGDVEGLHRLLKLVVLDLSFNKLTTSKALGQLAANYGSLLALNLLGNPVMINLGEDQMRKLVTTLTPHVTYLNKQPIKAISVREAVLDSVARAALGTSQRNSKSSGTKAVRKVAGAQPGTVQKKPPMYHRSKNVEKKLGSVSSSAGVSRQHHHHHTHHRQHHHHGKGGEEKGQGMEHVPLLQTLGELQNLTLDIGSQAMHRSRSDSALQE